MCRVNGQPSLLSLTYQQWRTPLVVSLFCPHMINDLWYKNAIIYCVSVDAYMAANADGIGDFMGLMRRRDYLPALRVTAIRRLPLQSQPCLDGGYVDPDY